MKKQGIAAILGGLGLITWGVISGDLPLISQEQSSLPNPPNPEKNRLCYVKPGSVYDGDTFRALCGYDELKIKMCGIDAPETDQPGGIESRDYLRSLLPDDAEIIVIPIETDRYGRTVAEVWNDAITNGDQFVNAQMVFAGQAWHYQQYSGNCPSRNAIANAARIGTQPTGTPPWEWHKNN
ncbi:MAG: thermonuclease family protein [Halothece sp.]